MEPDRPNGGSSSEAEEERPRKLEDHLTARSTWARLFFMIVIVILYSVSRIVVGVVVIVQFFSLLFTGQTNERLTETGQSLAVYTYQIVRYLTFNSELRPFPFDLDWPRPDVSADEAI